MKKLIALLLVSALTLAVCSCSGGGGSAKITVSVKITVMDSETGYSGTLYENLSYPYTLGSPSVDGLLNALTKEGKINYYYDGGFISINGFTYFNSVDNNYSRAWIVKVNGTTPSGGVLTDIVAGDAVELTYIVFGH